MSARTVGRTLVRLVSPILLYLLLSAGATGLLTLAWPALEAPEEAMWLLALSNALVTAALAILCRSELHWVRKEEGGAAAGLRGLFLAAVGGIFLARGFNAVIALTPLPQLFTGYEAVSETVYGCSLSSQLLASAVSAPVLEELLMRGLLYERLKSALPDRRLAILADALIFAVFHENVVQGVYAFLLGLFLLCVYEAYGALLPAILAHAAANASSLLLEQIDEGAGVFTAQPVALLTAALSLLLGVACWRRIAADIE